MDISKLNKIDIDPSFGGRDFHINEFAHLESLGLKPSPGLVLGVEGVNRARLFFKENKEIKKDVMADLKMIGAVTVVEQHNPMMITIVIVYKAQWDSILYYYLKARGVEFVSLFSIKIEEADIHDT